MTSLIFMCRSLKQGLCLAVFEWIPNKIIVPEFGTGKKLNILQNV